MENNTVLDRNIIEETNPSFDPRDRLANKGRRFANFLIDFIVTRVMVVVVYIILFMTRTLDTGDADNRLMEFGITVIIIVLYYAILEGTTGKTLGKLITGTRVVYEDGSKPSWGKIFGRSFARLIPFEPFSFLGSEVGWHDSMTNTYVIRDRMPNT